MQQRTKSSGAILYFDTIHPRLGGGPSFCRRQGDFDENDWFTRIHLHEEMPK